MPRLMSVAKTVRQIQEGTKDVTRRDGWLFAREGDVVELVEWSPRVGAQWVCPKCGVVPAGRFSAYPPSLRFCAHANEEGMQCLGMPVFRFPCRLGLRRIVSVHRERLGDITLEEVCREGFPEMSPSDFVALYCSPSKPDPDRIVTRIQLAEVE